jgi:hypothetical protein
MTASALGRALRQYRVSYPSTPGTHSNMRRARIISAATTLAREGVIEPEAPEKLRAIYFPGLNERRALSAQAGLSPAPKV